MGRTHGKFDKAKGRMKEAAGDLTDDEELEREGKADQAGGAVKEKVGDMADKVNEGVDRAKEAFTDDQ